MRSNIFERINATPIQMDICRIDSLIHNPVVYVKDAYLQARKISVESVLEGYFIRWEGRGTCISIEDMRNSLDIDRIVDGKSKDEDRFLTYLEYVANILSLPDADDRLSREPCFQMAIENLKRTVEKLHLKILRISENRFILVPKDSLQIQVAESVDEDLGNLILQYHHYLLKGNIAKKKAILIAMGKGFESRKKSLLGTEYSKLTDIVGFALNNLDLRHTLGEAQRKVIGSMNPRELEEMYDDVYDVLVFWFAAFNYVERIKPKLKQLKKVIDESGQE